MQQKRDKKLIKKLLFPIIASNRKSIEVIDELFSITQSKIDVDFYHSGYTPIPIFIKAEGEFYQI